MNRHLSAAQCLVGAALRGNVEYAILHVCSVCNAKCRMCFSWDGMMERHDVRGPSVEDLRRLAASMRPLPQLTCSGGEPFLRRDLPDIVQGFYDLAGTRFFGIPTNALKPDAVAAMIDHFVAHCPKGFLNFCLPFHGVGEHFEDILGVPGSFAKFNETFQLIRERRLRHANISCVLNFVMSKFNFDRYKEIIDLASRDYGDAPLGIAYCRGVTHEREATDVPVEVYLEAQRYLAGRRRTRSRGNPYTVMFDTIGAQIADTVSGVVTGECGDLACGAGRRFVVIYDDGSVYPCEPIGFVGMPCARGDGETPPSSACLGRLSDYQYDLSALLASPRAREAVAWLRSHPCACTWECAIYSKIVHSPLRLGRLAARAAARALGRRS